jgi:LTXXQ motif family protein
MSKTVIAGLAALVVVGGSLQAYAQTPAPQPQSTPNAAAMNSLVDERIQILKAVLQLNSDQEKYWPAIESAIRARAAARQARVAAVEQRVNELQGRSIADVVQNRDPVAFLRRRSDALAQRSADLKKLADAWQPLYATLNPDQKRRLALVSLIGLREIREAIAYQRMLDEEDDD